MPEIVNPFIGDGPSTPYTGTAYQSKHVGDIYDTSPYPSDNPPEIEPYVPRAEAAVHRHGRTGSRAWAG